MPKCRINLYDICHTLELGSTFDDFTFISLKRTCSDVLIFEKLPFLLTQLPKKCGSCQLASY